MNRWKRRVFHFVTVVRVIWDGKGSCVEVRSLRVLRFQLALEHWPEFFEMVH